MRSRGGRKSRPDKQRIPACNNTRAMVLVLPCRAKALEGTRRKPKQRIHKLYMIEHENMNRKEVSIMSGTSIRIGIDFGRGNTLFIVRAKIEKTLSGIWHNLLLEVERTIKERMNQKRFMDSTVLDVMHREDRSEQIEQIVESINDSLKRDRFSRRYIPDEAGKSAAATSCRPVDIRISGHRLDSVLSLDSFCHKEEIDFSGEEATEKQSIELPELSYSPAGNLWKDRRHRRRRGYVFRSAPWKLNSDKGSDAWKGSVLICA